MSTLQSMGLSLKDLIQMAFDSGVDAATEQLYEPSGYLTNGETTSYPVLEQEQLKRRFTDFLMMLGLDELKVN